MLEQASTIWWWAQGLGAFSMLVGWWANAQRDDQRLLRGNLVAAGLTALHLGLLGSPLGMTNQLVNAGRFALAQHWRHWSLALGFAVAALVQGALMASHWSEWCVVAAAVLSSVLLFQVQGRALRWGLLLCNALNLTLSVTLGSLSGILYQCVTMALLLQSLLATSQPQPQRS
ncbi:YgjV family protein [Ferrimonas marina]|uniref:Inner membrane protein n=1 Tax=Ferrimonas marina TaxID=299255 RepID=A0A1M5NW10_9GAMM|nr:YgjV family protein [Ferrimonas marina]SHG93635.1 inner membrane protein [Ferrimonas marina]